MKRALPLRPERSHIVWATVTGIPVLTLIGLVVLGYVYDWGWVGVSEATRPKPTDQALRWEKTLWDWLQLLVVPVAVAVGTFALNQAAKKREEESQQEQKEREQSIEEQRRKNDLEIEERRAHDAALNTYLDQMGQMLLAEGLRSSEEDADLRVLARARTLTTLGRIGPAHKGSVLRFLQEASLINKEKPVIRLFSADLSGADLAAFLLQDADLRSANLAGADLEQAIMFSALLRSADLRGARVESAFLRFADLRGAKLNNASLKRTWLLQANLEGADLRGANLQGADLSETNLTRAKLNGVTAGAVEIDGYRFQFKLDKANLTGASFVGADLSGATLYEANLDSTDLSGANLSWADLREADLRYTNLSDADLSYAELRYARINTMLRDVNLRNASFLGTNLENADLWGSQLHGANLSKAAGLTQEKIEQAIGDESTRLPRDLKRPEAWIRR